MSIQTGPGGLTIDANDPQFTFRGISVAIKIRQIMWPVILGCQRLDDGTWAVKEDLTDDLFASDVPGQPDSVKYWVAHHGGARGFVTNVVLAKLNAWLAKVFTPAGEVSENPLELIFAELGNIKFTSHTDGTVTASF